MLEITTFLRDNQERETEHKAGTEETMKSGQQQSWRVTGGTRRRALLPVFKGSTYSEQKWQYNNPSHRQGIYAKQSCGSITRRVLGIKKTEVEGHHRPSSLSKWENLAIKEGEWQLREVRHKLWSHVSSVLLPQLPKIRGENSSVIFKLYWETQCSAFITSLWNTSSKMYNNTDKF